MQKRNLLWPCVALAAAALLITPTFATQPAPDPGSAQIETEFLMGMVPHHRSAVAMAQMASAKATHQELKNLAQSIADGQNREIAQMSQWLRDWYGMDPSGGTSMPDSAMQGMMPMLHGRMPDMDAGMLDLQSKSGSDFEAAFLSDMTRHHAMAIMMTGPVLMGGYHSDLLNFAENIAITQGQEVKQMGEWLQSWYGLERPLDRPMMPMPMQQNSTPMPMDMSH